VGIVTRGDILRDDCGDTEPLLDHASTQVVNVGPADPAQTALRVMVDEAIEHVPVLDGDELVGICTRTDLLKVRRRQFDLERPQAGLAARAANHSAVRRLRPALATLRRGNRSTTTSAAATDLATSPEREADDDCS
jgi:signal-transduction protein with cAMP-binding, CBS, and nucleotidyltransferase domain